LYYLYVKKILPVFAAMVLLGIISFSMGTAPASAEEKPLDIQIQTWNNGKIKENRWFPVKVTITNPGDDVSGDLVVKLNHNNGNKNSAYVKSLDLPHNSTKVEWLVLPGTHFDKNNNKIIFYKDSLDSGESIDFTKKSVYIETFMVSRETLQVGLLASDPDTLNFLALLNQNNYQVNIIPLNQEDLPAESLMLDNLDILAINDFAADQLTDSQEAAIHTWVKQGGQLILAGGASYPKSAESFKDLSPVEYLGTSAISSFPSLEAAAGKELAMTSPFTVSNVKVKAGETIIAEGNIPLFVKQEIRKGSVLYAAYDLALNPLASWNGNVGLWEQILSDKLQKANTVGQVHFGNEYWEMNQALDQFAALLPPALGIMVWIFLAYALIVAPLLYILLKKWDKREWAWIIVPGIAVISSFCIFAVGASDRTSTLSQTLNVIEIDDTGQGSMKSAAAVFVPRGGKFDIELAEHQYAMPFQEDYYNNNLNDLDGSIDQVVFLGEKEQRVQFRNVPFWSIRKFWIHEGTTREYGKFDYTMKIEQTSASGEITNLTGHDLQDVSLVINQQLLKLGDMKSGETQSFQQSLASFQSGHHQNIAQQLFPYMGNQDEYIRERALLSSAMNARFNAGVNNKTVIIAVNRDNQATFAINGKPVMSKQTNLWIQEVTLNYVENGQIFIPFGHIEPEITSNSTQFLNSDPYNSMLDLGKGNIEFEYMLPRIAGVDYTNLRISTNINFPASSTLEIWDVKQQAWAPYLNNADTNYANEYIGDYRVRMKFINNEEHAGFQYPEISVEGIVNP
jgi:hypothetical protein